MTKAGPSQPVAVRPSRTGPALSLGTVTAQIPFSRTRKGRDPSHFTDQPKSLP
ncbi:hypothetical protein ACFQ05_38115 [Amycolatopsis umgeniensis]|uniref:Uncharacterized protein n=1 Tax=Amycolatopsis umgeniensis TaxID=336628 RepID=A0A841AY91_9PSEU|nr:hypothetical protein [Amycolatopsis umgeniensis]MBB5851244.1 hypothetical protein [Amycolatopsis umgeniensis]